MCCRQSSCETRNADVWVLCRVVCNTLFDLYAGPPPPAFLESLREASFTCQRTSRPPSRLFKLWPLLSAGPLCPVLPSLLTQV